MRSDGPPDVSSGVLSDAGADAPAGCGETLAWTRVPGSPAGFAISGSSASDIWLLATEPTPSAGTLMRGDGSTWSPASATGTALWVSGPNDVLVGSQALEHWDGSAWTTYSLQDNRMLEHFWGTSPTDVWGSSDSSAYLGHWDGHLWHFDGDFAAGPLAGGARGDLWAALFTQLGHHSPPDANVTFSYDATLILASLGFDAGQCGASGHCLHGSWASATDDVWFVGEAGLGLHYDGAMWSVNPLLVSTTLRGIWGTSRHDVWAVGDAGVLLHFDGVRWSPGPTLTTAALASVWMSGLCDVWAIGDAVYHGAPR